MTTDDRAADRVLPDAIFAVVTSDGRHVAFASFDEQKTRKMAWCADEVARYVLPTAQPAASAEVATLRRVRQHLECFSEHIPAAFEVDKLIGEAMAEEARAAAPAPEPLNSPRRVALCDAINRLADASRGSNVSVARQNAVAEVERALLAFTDGRHPSGVGAPPTCKHCEGSGRAGDSFLDNEHDCIVCNGSGKLVAPPPAGSGCEVEPNETGKDAVRWAMLRRADELGAGLRRVYDQEGAATISDLVAALKKEEAARVRAEAENQRWNEVHSDEVTARLDAEEKRDEAEAKLRALLATPGNAVGALAQVLSCGSDNGRACSHGRTLGDARGELAAIRARATEAEAALTAERAAHEATRARHKAELDEAYKKVAELSEESLGYAAHRNQLQEDLEREQAGRLELRKRCGATDEETFGAFVTRVVGERDAARRDLAAAHEAGSLVGEQAATAERTLTRIAEALGMMHEPDNASAQRASDEELVRACERLAPDTPALPADFVEECARALWGAVERYGNSWDHAAWAQQQCRTEARTVLSLAWSRFEALARTEEAREALCRGYWDATPGYQDQPWDEWKECAEKQTVRDHFRKGGDALLASVRSQAGVAVGVAAGEAPKRPEHVQQWIDARRSETAIKTSDMVLLYLLERDGGGR